MVFFIVLTAMKGVKRVVFNLLCQKIKIILTIKRFHFMIIYVNDYYKLKIDKGDVFNEKQSKMEWRISSNSYSI